MKYADVENTLAEIYGYEIKKITRNRMAIVTDKRQAAIDITLSAFRGARLVRDKTALNISSLGIVQIGPTQVIAKPKTKNVLKAEQEATEILIDVIKDAVEQEGKPIRVKIGKYNVENVVTAAADQIKGDPKADIALINDSTKEVGFISHKKAGGARAYQQYGGISLRSGQIIHEDILVEKYVRDLNNFVTREYIDGAAGVGFSAWRKIEDTPAGRNLVGRSVYGPMWNNGATFNRESVHCIGQGAPILTRNNDGSYKLTFSESIHTADDLTWAFRGEYQAIFATTYRNGRTTSHQDIIVRNARSGIYPYDFITSRRATEI